MGVQLDKVVVFGRSFDEYLKMFNLKEVDLQKKIVSVADGIASFNAEATLKGTHVISVDPIYELTNAQIEQRFYEVVDNIMSQIKATPNDWSWSYHKSVDDLRENRVKVLEAFLSDYQLGKTQNRYQIGQLPILPYEDNEFDLALCSHFLFLYSQQLDENFHYHSLVEMLRISKEVRVFPLLTLMLETSFHLDNIIEKMRRLNYQVSVEKVEYELQKGGNKMLKISKNN